MNRLVLTDQQNSPRNTRLVQGGLEGADFWALPGSESYEWGTLRDRVRADCEPDGCGGDRPGYPNLLDSRVRNHRRTCRREAWRRPDKVAFEQRGEYAEAAYETFIDVLPEQWSSIRFQTLYGREVAATISEGAKETGATVIAFTPRGGSRWARLVTGDIARKLIDNSDVPVISLPEPSMSIVL